MTLDQKINTFVELGNFLRQFTENDAVKNPDVKHNEIYFDDFADLIALSQSHNGWFTREQVVFAIGSWANALRKNELAQWLSKYELDVEPLKRVGLILAGNIPLVGFHDLLSVLMSGNKAIIKTSSNDQHLLPFLTRYIVAIEPAFGDRITITSGKLENFDAVIATGSNNTARYFEYYFKDRPSIIRKNRNSAAVLTGNETNQQLFALGEDIFRYFGLGCRNVSKLFVPENYDFTAFFKAIYEYRDVIYYEKYANNYDYNKAVFLMSNFKLLDNEFLTLKEDKSYASPISSVFFEYYSDLDTLKLKLAADAELLQCVVSDNVTDNSIGFGETQRPKLWDYADGVDTMNFLIKL